ncbi:MAG TPA: 50S ribosomal protein L31 [Candidatus Paceibacterota bacterium]|nr:50S ribosomal protein L31 [Candidatus Paceibacterota bacterium]
MKKDIHPKYFAAKAICACGAEYDIASTQEVVHVEVCSACHPFYTGKSRTIDTAGRVDKFQKRREKAQELSKK